jgi:biotin transport system substrate-specific component
MTAFTAPTSTVLADLVPGARARDVALTVSGAAITGVCAQISFSLPYTPVPVTLQTFAVLVVGGTLGARRGTVSMLIYLLAGAIGLPWFSGGSSGWGGPTFGYLIGFVVAAGLTGLISQTRADRHPVTTALQFAVGTAFSYLIGMVWLAADLKLNAAAAFHLGVKPFLPFDAAKIVFAAAVLPASWAVARRFGRDA